MTSSVRRAVAIVTGGSCAIGREVARELAGHGHAITVVYLDDQREAEATVEKVLDAGGTAVTVRADLADDLDVDRLFTETIALFGRVDLVVHTVARDASVLVEHASLRLGRGSAIVSVSRIEHLEPGLVERLREREIRIVEALSAVERPGAGRTVAELLASALR